MVTSSLATPTSTPGPCREVAYTRLPDLVANTASLLDSGTAVAYKLAMMSTTCSSFLPPHRRGLRWSTWSLVICLLVAGCGPRQPKGDANTAIREWLVEQGMERYTIADAVIFEDEVIQRGDDGKKRVAYYWVYVWHPATGRPALKLQVDRAGRVSRDDKPIRR